MELVKSITEFHQEWKGLGSFMRFGGKTGFEALGRAAEYGMGLQRVARNRRKMCQKERDGRIENEQSAKGIPLQGGGALAGETAGQIRGWKTPGTWSWSRRKGDATRP